MRLRRALRPSLRALLAHRVRAALVLSSVATGVAAVLVTAAVGRGAERELARTLEALGTDLLVVRPAAVSRFPGRRQVRGTVTSLEVGDAEAIAELALVREAAPSAEGMLRVKAGNGALLTMVLGTSPAFPAVRRFRLREGRFFGPADDRESRRVAVLGARVGETLFPGESPIGRQIRLRSVLFEVIGVLEAKGVQADGADEDTKVVIPLRTALRRVFNATWLSNVFVRVRDPARMAALLASLAMAVVTGVGFGAFPARRASLMPPTEALGTE